MRYTAWTLLLFVAIHCAPAFGQQQKPAPAPGTVAKAPDKKKVAAPTQSAPGMRVFIDPRTGQIRQPDPEELQIVSSQLVEAPQRIVSSTGLDGLRLTENQMIYSVARKNPDGTVTFDCVDGRPAAVRVLEQPAQSKTAASKETGDVK